MQAAIRSYLGAQKTPENVYPFLRRLFRQEKGPNIATLLAVLPKDYLRTVELLLTLHTSNPKSSGAAPQTASKIPARSVRERTPPLARGESK